MHVDFVHTCGCSDDAVCQGYDDRNMMCVDMKCQCHVGYTYNRKHNKCVNSEYILICLHVLYENIQLQKKYTIKVYYLVSIRFVTSFANTEELPFM